MYLVYPPIFCTTIDPHFSWVSVITVVPRAIKDNGFPIFFFCLGGGGGGGEGEINKVPCGLCKNGEYAKQVFVSYF